ncbi:MAG: class II aldolase/adducin family protein [Thermoanaerobaculia bacterium]|nr:class II aldolase/adducin family protein [Thermoanaerobaculia bacterium]
MSDARERAREETFDAARAMHAARLVAVSSGNVSCRVDGEAAIAITPTSVAWDDLQLDQIAIVALDGTLLDAPFRPSAELPLHLAVYHARADAGAVVHTHGTSVTALSLLRRPLPPVIDEIVAWFGGEVEVAEYAFSGTAALARNVVAALGDRAAVILASHGDVCVGATAGDALRVASLMESAAAAYLTALAAGEPVRLTDEAIAAARAIYLRRMRR